MTLKMRSEWEPGESDKNCRNKFLVLYIHSTDFRYLLNHYCVLNPGIIASSDREVWKKNAWPQRTCNLVGKIRLTHRATMDSLQSRVNDVVAMRFPEGSPWGVGVVWKASWRAWHPGEPWRIAEIWPEMGWHWWQGECDTRNLIR